MTLDPEIREKVYGYFIAEAQDLLKEIEHDLLSFKEDHTPAKIHNLLRSVHTLKGGAASVGLETIKNVAHVLEDIFTALRNPNISIDAEIEVLLFQGYECLRSPLIAEITGGQIDDADVLNRAATIIAQIQMKVGDCFHQETELPTSADLGFDVVQQMFEIGVSQRLNDLQDILLESKDSTVIAAALQEKAEVFLGLAESLNLPGFGAIAQATLQALEQHPNQSLEIAQTALSDFSAGKTAILAGDRSEGGSPSERLLSLSGSGSEVQSNSLTHASELDLQLIDDDWNIAELTGVDEISGNVSPDSAANQTDRLINAQVLPSDPQDGITVDWTQFIASHTDLSIGLSSDNLSSDDLSSNSLSSNSLSSDSLSSDGSEDKLMDTSIVSPAASQTSTDSEPASSPEMGEELSLDELFGSYITSDMPEETQVDSSVDLNSIGVIEHPESEVDIMPFAPVATDAQPVGKPALDAVSHRESPTPETTPVSIYPPHSEVVSIPQTTQTHSQAHNVHPQVPLTNLPQPVAMKHEVRISKPMVAKRSREGITQTVRVELNQLERLNHLAGELLIEYNQQNNQDDQHRSMAQVLLQRLRKFQQTMGALRDWSDRNYAKPELNPDATGMTANAANPKYSLTEQSLYQTSQFLTGFDSLEMDRYSELDFVVQSALEDSVQIESLVEAIEQVSKQSKRSARKQKQLLTNLRDDLTATRMQPLGELLNRFPRVLNQLSATYGKSVELGLRGADVFVDKAIVEKLYDPLLHLIRNGFDHGIEDAETRRSLHKPEQGRLEIRAFHQGNRTIIEIKDDGKGIDLQRVGQRAVEVGLIGAHQLDSLHPSQILEFLFEPGFSTAAQVSDLSGRGVGLDVVRSQIQALNGTVTVSSIANKGTTFSLQIPLSLTIVKLLVCQTNGIAYTLPVAAIEQIICPQVGQLEILKSDRLVLHWQQDQQKFDVPVRHLIDLVHYSTLSSRLLGFHSQSGVIQNSPVLIMRTASGLYGLQVDQVLGEQELVIRPVESAIAPPDYVYGCCILSDSRLALAVNVEALLQRAANQERSQPRWETRSARQRSETVIDNPQEQSQRNSIAMGTSTSNRVLLIDDSLTLRQALALTLEKAEYQVAQAGDGSEALAYLRRNPGTINLIVCDVEMPRLNGFEFLSQLRHDPALANIPVMMLTSRSGTKYRQLAQALGATAYLTKPYTDSDLLAQIAVVLNQRSALILSRVNCS